MLTAISLKITREIIIYRWKYWSLEPLLDWRLASNVLEVGWGRGRGSLPPDHHHLWLPSLLDGRHRVVGAVGGQATCLKVDAVVGNVDFVKSGTVYNKRSQSLKKSLLLENGDTSATGLFLVSTFTLVLRHHRHGLQ